MIWHIGGIAIGCRMGSVIIRGMSGIAVISVTMVIIEIVGAVGVGVVCYHYS